MKSSISPSKRRPLHVVVLPSTAVTSEPPQKKTRRNDDYEMQTSESLLSRMLVISKEMEKMTQALTDLSNEVKEMKEVIRSPPHEPIMPKRPRKERKVGMFTREGPNKGRYFSVDLDENGEEIDASLSYIHPGPLFPFNGITKEGLRYRGFRNANDEPILGCTKFL